MSTSPEFAHQSKQSFNWILLYRGPPAVGWVGEAGWALPKARCHPEYVFRVGPWSPPSWKMAAYAAILENGRLPKIGRENRQLLKVALAYVAQ